MSHEIKLNYVLILCLTHVMMWIDEYATCKCESGLGMQVAKEFQPTCKYFFEMVQIP